MEKRVHLPVLSPSDDLVALEPLALAEIASAENGAPTIDLRSLELDKRQERRTSSYTIYVDLPDNDEELLLVHGYTGAFDRVSRRVANYLRSLEARHAPKPLYGDWSGEPATTGEATPPSDETIAVLERRGYLVALTPDEEEAFLASTVQRTHRAVLKTPPGYIIMPTYQCNLRCHYCFQDHMRTDPAYSHLLREMDQAMVDRLIRGMRSLEAAHGIPEGASQSRSVTFFGGEPLLASSRPVIEYWIRRLQDIGKADISAITNATELHHYTDLLGEGGISVIQVTLDGPPAEHDKRRIHPDGSGSFEQIAQNISLALDRGVTVNVRMNIDRNNIGDLPELAAELERRGWTSHKSFSAYVAAIHAGNDSVDRRSVFTSWQLGQALEKLMEKAPSLAHFGTMDDSLRARARNIFSRSKGGAMARQTAFCSAHSTMYVLDAFADLYACWERTGDPEVRIGHITESGDVLMNRALLQTWRNRSAVSNPVCRKCRYVLSCGGGCAVYAEEASGDLYRNHCDGFAKRFRHNVAEAYLEHLSGTSRRATALRLCDV